MNKKWANVCQRAAKALDGLVWENGFVVTGAPGHTREAAQCARTRSGRITSERYCLARLLGKRSQEQGLETLQALESLQVTEGMDNPQALPRLDAGSQAGAFRWYAEETRIWDTNAAFFICMPLILHRLRVPDIFSASETQRIDAMLSRAGNWFYHECEHAIYYYSNKILSDGAALCGIAYLTKNEKYRQMAVQFFQKWLDYTKKRGWGWGENLSLGYNGVIFPALRVAESTIGDAAIAEQLRSILEEQKRLFRFYDGHELVPTIRSYNYGGDAERTSLVFNLAGVPGNGLDVAGEYSDLFCAFADELYEDDAALYASGKYCPVSAPRERKTRIFDGVYADSWYGEHGGIGSLNAFPVISGTDCNVGWGLGWQSMPVSFVIYGCQTGYLRFYVDDGECVRAHPKRNYLSPELFPGKILPRVTTRSGQSASAVLTVRAIDRLRNRAREVADEYYVPRFDGALYETSADGRPFIALLYQHATVVIGALLGIAYDGARRQQKLEVCKEADALRIRQILYQGQTQLLEADRLESAWLTVYIDRAMAAQEAEDFIRNLRISDVAWSDGQEPRANWALLRSVCVEGNGISAHLETDPYRFPGGNN